jgi:hypothetical protein
MISVDSWFPTQAWVEPPYHDKVVHNQGGSDVKIIEFGQKCNSQGSELGLTKTLGHDIQIQQFKRTAMPVF